MLIFDTTVKTLLNARKALFAQSKGQHGEKIAKSMRSEGARAEKKRFASPRDLVARPNKHVTSPRKMMALFAESRNFACVHLLFETCETARSLVFTNLVLDCQIRYRPISLVPRFPKKSTMTNASTKQHSLRHAYPSASFPTAEVNPH